MNNSTRVATAAGLCVLASTIWASTPGTPRAQAPQASPSLYPDMARVRAALLSAYNLLQGADVAPTSQAIGAAADALAASRTAMAKR